MASYYIQLPAVSVTVTNFPAVQPVSGTVTANQGLGGASPWLIDANCGLMVPLLSSLLSNLLESDPRDARTLWTKTSSPAIEPEEFSAVWITTMDMRSTLNSIAG